MKPRWDRKDWLVLGGLLVLTVIAFWRVIFLRQFSFGVENDFLRQFYPARVYEVKSLASGSFPLWSPYVLSGQAFFASYQTAMLYPFNLLMVGAYALAGASFPLKAQNIFVVFHLYLAGVFTYLLARDLDAGRTGSTIAAITFMFSGFMVAHAGHINQVSTAAWMPLIFFLFNRSLVRRKWPYAVAAGGAMGVALLAGHLQSVFYLCALLAGLVVFRAWQHYRSQPEMAGPLFGVGALALVVAIAGGLAAAQLIPTYQLIGLSTRSRIPYAIAQTSSLPRYQVLNLLFPKFFGTTPHNYVGGWLMWETYGYSGIVAGALGVVALLRKKRGMAIFLWVALIVSLILALGPGGYLFTALFKLGIFVNRFHDPARIVVIFAFTSALLAGLGAGHIVEVYGSGDRKASVNVVKLVGLLTGLLVIVALGLVAFLSLRNGKALANHLGLRSMIMPVLLVVGLLVVLLVARQFKLNVRALGALLIVLVAVDVILLNAGWVVVKVNPNDIYADKAASTVVAAQARPFRVETDAFNMYRAYDDGALYSVEKATGDDSLVLADYDNYRQIILPQQAPGVQVGLFYEGAINSPMLDAENDVYFMTRKPINPKLLAPGKLKLFGKFGSVYVYRNTIPLPRAFVVDAAAYSDNQKVYQVMLATRGKDLHNTSLVVMPSVAAARGQGARIGAVSRPVKVVSQSASRLVLAVDPAAKGLMTVSELYYPGWQAYLDGRKVDTFKTDLMFRGVMLPGGQKTVEFRFEPTNINAGAVISLVILAFLIGYFGALIVRRRVRKRDGKGELEAVGPDTGL